MDLVGPHCHPLQVKSSPRPRVLFSPEIDSAACPSSRCRRLLRLQMTQVSSVRPSAAHINDMRLPRQLLRRHTSVPPPAHHCYINCCAGHSRSHPHPFPFSGPHHYCPPWLPRAPALFGTGGRRTTRRWEPLLPTGWPAGSRRTTTSQWRTW